MMPSPGPRLVIAPAVPLDARVVSARVDGGEVAFEVARVGDIQRAQVVIPQAAATTGGW